MQSGGPARLECARCARPHEEGAGSVIVSIVEGEIEVVNGRDCVRRTDVTGEAFIHPGQGNVHIASHPSPTDDAVAYATFLGVPDGMPATTWVTPVACRSPDSE